MAHARRSLLLRSRAARRTSVVTWALVFVCGAFAAGTLFSSLDADLDGPASFESERVGATLHALDPGGGEVVAILDGVTASDAHVADAIDGLERTDGVAEVQTMPSDDGHALGIAVRLAGELPESTHDDVVADVARQLRDIDAPEVLVGGELLLDEEVAELAERDAQRAELLSLPVALVVLTIVFGGLFAAGLPLLLAFSGIGASMLVLTAASTVTDISLYAVNVALMLGLGLGIDYGLLLVTRFREERGAGLGIDDAIGRTMAHAGRTVVFSGLTVAVALAGLLLFEDPTIRSLGIAGIAVVAACVASALTLFPVALRRVGHRLRPETGPRDHGWFAALARLIQRRAAPVAVLVATGLAVLALPFAGARFDDLGAAALPRSAETRQVADAIEQRFTSVSAEPIEVVAAVDAEDAALASWIDRVQDLPGVVELHADDASRDGLTVVEVHAAGPSNGSTSQSVVRALRDLDAPFSVLVGGDPAEIVDFRDSISARLPLVVAVIVLATFVLLFVMTGSVVVPIKAIVMNVLSLGATFGALVWIFQDGHLSGVLGFDAPGSLDLVMPVVVFVFAFGLSMDYEVFLLACIREVWEETGDNDLAVAIGLQRSGRIITSAALLIVIVFAGFAAGDIVAMKQLGIGLALAVVIDATVVRSLLVPATMKLVGDRNWWAPPAMARLHRRIGVREA